MFDNISDQWCNFELLIDFYIKKFKNAKKCVDEFFQEGEFEFINKCGGQYCRGMYVCEI